METAELTFPEREVHILKCQHRETRRN